MIKFEKTNLYEQHDTIQHMLTVGRHYKKDRD